MRGSTKALILCVAVFAVACGRGEAPKGSAAPEASADVGAKKADVGVISKEGGVPPTPKVDLDKVTWEGWDTAAMAACDARHQAQVGRWIQSLCKVRVKTRSKAWELAGHVQVASVPLPYNAAPSEAVIHWDAHSIEVPSRTGMGGRQATFKDEGSGPGSFDAQALRRAFPDIKGTPILAIDKGRPMSEVIEALGVLKSGNYSKVAFAFETSAYEVPLPPKPALLKKFRWQAAAPFMRDAMAGCDQALATFKMSIKVHPDERCVWLSDQLPRAIGACQCKMKSHDDFLVNLQLFLKPPRIITATTVALEGTPTAVDPTKTWGELAPVLFEGNPTQLLLSAQQ